MGNEVGFVDLFSPPNAPVTLSLSSNRRRLVVTTADKTPAAISYTFKPIDAVEKGNEPSLSIWYHTLFRLVESCRRAVSLTHLATKTLTSGITSIELADSTTFVSSIDMSISEWKLETTADSHGLFEQYFLSPIRRFSLPSNIISNPSVSLLRGVIRVGHNHLCAAVGSFLVILDITPNKPPSIFASSPHSTARIHSFCFVSYIDSSPSPSSSSSSSSSSLASDITYHDEIWTCDANNSLFVWKLANLSSPPTFLLEIEPAAHSRILSLAQVNPYEVWATTNDSTIIGWDILHHSVLLKHPFSNSSSNIRDRRPCSAITTSFPPSQVGLQDSSRNQIVWAGCDNGTCLRLVFSQPI